ncbi:hypothetical protein Golax_019408 [Gossypium laxum]|uniref:RNase H type-1 domain-containing protein n=1 Tax=Gossypium laxum TaxID=34288 RepID=A0A7J8Z679_9ROSI|nr:hypothetical protein [Gossypium laxum]
MCPRCTGEVENTKYVFRDCSVTKEIWQKLDFVWPPLDREKLPSRGQEIERWRLLEGSNLKINFDVAFNKQENTSCSRIVIRNSNGGVLGSKTVLNRNVPSAFAAEALACAQVVQMGLEIYLSTVEVEGDSLPVINKSQSNGVDKSEICESIKNK